MPSYYCCGYAELPAHSSTIERCTHHGITILVTAVIIVDRGFGTDIWVWYGDLAGPYGNIGRYVLEFGFEFWFHLTKVVPFSCWYGLAPSPLPLLLLLLLLLLNVHDNTRALTGRSRPPAFIPRARSTGPTALYMIYLLITRVSRDRG